MGGDVRDCEGSRSNGSDIVPYWVYRIDGGAQMRTARTSCPLSKEQEHLEFEALVSCVQNGIRSEQPRRLNRYLLDHFPESEINRITEEMRIKT